jgi:hypothetical protein
VTLPDASCAQAKAARTTPAARLRKAAGRSGVNKRESKGEGRAEQAPTVVLGLPARIGDRGCLKASGLQAWGGRARGSARKVVVGLLERGGCGMTLV